MIPTLLQILRLWLEIRAKRASWELERDIAKYCDDIENQILEARASGNDAVADRLRERFTRSSKILVSSQQGNP
jgi:predicted ATPase